MAQHRHNITSPVNVEERRNLEIKAGDTVRVHFKIQEKGKTRLQMYEGMVIARKHGGEAGATITVRKVASGVGMEKVIPLYSPSVSKIELVKRSKARRAKLYYIRAKAAKEVARKMRELRGVSTGVLADEDRKSAATEEAPTETPAQEETVATEA